MAEAATAENDVVIAAAAPKKKRILAFDLIRGFFLLVIMIDHIERYPNGWDFLPAKAGFGRQPPKVSSFCQAC
jgi:uncharacterized membrane protein